MSYPMGQMRFWEWSLAMYYANHWARYYQHRFTVHAVEPWGWRVAPAKEK